MVPWVLLFISYCCGHPSVMPASSVIWEIHRASETRRAWTRGPYSWLPPCSQCSCSNTQDQKNLCPVDSESSHGAGRGRVEMHKAWRPILSTLPFPGENSEKSKNLQYEPSGLVSSEYLCEHRVEQILSVDKLNFECLHYYLLLS